MKVREATLLDFDDIYKLLKRLNDTSFSKRDWQKITTVDFNTRLKHYGYVLEDNAQILGFIGTIFSSRKHQGKTLNYCNIHSWIVDPKAKTAGMILLLKVLKLKNHVITNFTASEGPYKIFKSLKFNQVNYKNYKLLPFQSFKSKSKICLNKINDKNAQLLLDIDELILYKNHKQFENVQFLHLKMQDKSAFVITKRKCYTPGLLNKVTLFKKLLSNKLALAEIHYISNSDLFLLGFSNTRTALKICRYLGTAGVIIANRYLPKSIRLRKKLYPSKRPYVYRHAEDDDIVDTLYSELFVLNF